MASEGLASCAVCRRACTRPGRYPYYMWANERSVPWHDGAAAAVRTAPRVSLHRPVEPARGRSRREA